jgi:hypothetical protein
MPLDRLRTLGRVRVVTHPAVRRVVTGFETPRGRLTLPVRVTVDYETFVEQTAGRPAAWSNSLDAHTGAIACPHYGVSSPPTPPGQPPASERPEPTTVVRLTRLRSFLHAAQAAATDQTSTGRHAAVVALDGVCEMAMGLAAREEGLEIKEREGMPPLLRRLAGELGSRWRHGGTKGFLELHRARNAAQHDGVTPAVEHIATWAAEVERFTKSLVAAVFGVELDEVFAADAVESDELRGLLVDAEREVTAGNIRESLRLSRRAFERALSAFQGQRREARLNLGPAPLHSLGVVPGVKELREAVEFLRTFVDVATFASDPGEWVWLESVTPAFEIAEDAVTRADAYRALVFVVPWILRYESFAARYLPFDRIYIVPRSADPYTRYDQPRMVSIERAPALDRGSTPAYTVELSDVPPGWDMWVINARASIDLKGTTVWIREGKLAMTVPDGTSATDLLEVIEKVISETHRLFEATLDTSRRELERRSAAAVEYQRALAAQMPDGEPPVVIAEGLWTGEEIALRVEVPLPSDVGAFELERAMNAILEAREPPASVRVSGDGIYVAPSALPAHELPAVMEQAITAIYDRRNAEQREQSALEQQRLGMIQAVTELVHLPE